MSDKLGYQSIKGIRDSIGVLDIGSHKIACLIAEPDEEGNLHITGIGHTSAKGLRGGTIIDSKAAEQSIVTAVNMAEQMAGGTLDNVMVNLSLPNIHSQTMQVELNIAGGSVSDQDISDILHEACQSVANPTREIIHCFVTHYQLDGAKGIRDPRSMYGMLLKADVHVITVDKHSLVNLSNTISRCHLDIAEFIVSPHAAALGCLESDECELGVTVIDMGATETGFSIFHGGANVFSGVVPIGGNHVTKDLAQGLSTGISHAERLKTLHGSVLASANDDQQMIHVPRMGDYEEIAEDSQVPRAELIHIIHPRLDEMFELILDHIDAAQMAHFMGQNVVLTGGGSQLVGVRELVTDMYSKQVRIGKPKLFPGLAESVSGPAFAAPIGMLHYAINRPFEDALITDARSRRNYGGLGRLVQWFKNNF